MKSAGSELAIVEPNGKKPKPFRDWPGLRAEYETSGRKCSIPYLSKREGIPLSTITQRSWKEGWKKHETLAKEVLHNIQNGIEQRAVAIAEDRLAPWIEEHKAKFIKRSFAVANRGVSRVAKHQRDNKERVEARDEANMAKALESFARVGRQALGLGDGSPVTGVLNFSMLSNKTAIQVNNQVDQ